MKEENLKIYERKLDYLLDQLDRRGVKFISYNNIDAKYPTANISISGGLKKWEIGVWATGKWSDYYATDSESKINIFLIHSWWLDKFRPSSADISFEVGIDPEDNSDMDSVIDFLVTESRASGRNLYEETFWDRSYYKDYWQFEILDPGKENLKYTWSPLMLYWILKGISVFDPRVQTRRTLKYISDGCPKYTFGFLATEKCSEDNDSFKGFYNLYSAFPRRLKKWTAHSLFSAAWNVSDYVEGMTDKEIRKRLWKGVYIDED